MNVVVKAIKGLQKEVKAAQPKESQLPADFKPVRRVVKIGNQLLFDDNPTSAGRGGGGTPQGTVGNLVYVPVANPDGTNIGGGEGGGLTDAELRASAVAVSVEDVATETKQDDANTLLTAIKTALEILDDWDASDRTTSNNQYGWVATKGKVTTLKADGTTDIAIGDFLSAFTTAEIVKKASTGETAIAIALEAYTADNSSGVLDAMIIDPRLV